MREGGAGKREVAFLAVILAYYLWVAASGINLPGLEYDEVNFIPAALGNPSYFNTFSVSLSENRHLPVMLMPYLGAVKCYLFAPIFSLWGVSPATVRIPAVMTGALALVLFYGVLRAWASAGVALLSLAFLASDPSYIFHTRLDWGPCSLSFLLAFLSLFFLARWVPRRNPLSLAAAFLALGVGLYNKLDFGGFVIALLGAWCLMGRRRVRPVRLRDIGCAAVFFGIGALPFLSFLVSRPQLAASSLDLIAPVSALSLKGYVLWKTFNGMAVYDFVNGLSFVNVGKVVSHGGEITIGSFAAPQQSVPSFPGWEGTLTPYLVILFSVMAAVPRLRLPRRLRALVVFLFLLALQLLLVRGAVRSHHFVILLPFIYVLVAEIFVSMYTLATGKGRTHPALRIGISAVIALALATNTTVNRQYLRSFEETGGRGIWSDAIYEVTAYLREDTEKPLLVGDWGLATQLVALSHNRLPVEEIFWRYRGPEVSRPEMDDLAHLLRDERNRFVFFTDSYVNFSQPKRLFSRVAKQTGMRIMTEKVFFQRDGTPVIELLRFEAGSR